MISRAQEKTLSGVTGIRKMPQLSALEKAMLKWAVVDPEDRVLDANVGSGMLADYLRRNMQCEVCGVSDQMECVREARSRLRNCDIVYAAQGDIPWMENAFDTVLIRYGGEEEMIFHRMLTETERVLKPGGQLVLGTVYYPAVVNRFAKVFADTELEERCFFERAWVKGMLEICGFEKPTWQRTGLTTGVMTAWKRNPEVDEIRKSCS